MARRKYLTVRNILDKRLLNEHGKGEDDNDEKKVNWIKDIISKRKKKADDMNMDRV